MWKLAVILLFPALALAEPGPVTRKLMGEPASMFDVGMLRLKMMANWQQRRGHIRSAWNLAVGSKAPGFAINPGYIREHDKIYVGISVRDDSLTDEQMANGCDKALQQLQIDVSKSVPSIFQHHSNADPTEFNSLRAGLLDVFELRCYVSGNDSSDGRFWATKRLDSDEMAVGKWQLIGD